MAPVRLRSAMLSLPRESLKPAALALFFVALNALDAGTTTYLAARGATEVNPLMAGLLSIGTGTFVTMKVSTSMVFAALLMRFTPWSLKVLCVSFVGIVAFQITLCATS